MNTQTVPFAAPHAASPVRLAVFGLVFAVLAVGAAFAPPIPFIIDGGIYLDMARAMAERGALHIAADGGVEGAPALTKHLTIAVDGLVYPNYPGGYAVLAAPFYLAFGVRGLMLMNALATAACVLLVYRLARRLYGDDKMAAGAAAIFLAATFILNYAWAIWPHAVALLCWLGAAAAAVEGWKSEDGRSRAQWLAAAGLLIGTGVTIRLDTILAFAAIAVWLKLVARPADRAAPLWLAAGMVPGLLAAMWLNYAKFGALTPLTYGRSDGLVALEAYLPLAAAGGAFLLVMWAVNLPALAGAAVRRFGVKTVAAGLALAALAGVALAGDAVWRVARGVYVLVINLQAHDAYYQAGVERNEYGQLLFWGFPKRAFVQSLPYMPLLLIPAAGIFRRRHIEAAALSFLVIAAPVALYALNQWHGGGSYNMRYFIPALPFVAILSAVAMRDLFSAAGDVEPRRLLPAAVFAAVLFMVMQQIGRGSDALYAPASLYPQWVAAGLCAVLAAAHLADRASRTRARAALFAAAFALAYGAFVSLDDAAGHEKTRADQLAAANDIADAIPDGALVLTRLPVLFTVAETRGVNIMVPTVDNVEETQAAAAAFAGEGRCVYVHHPFVKQLVEPSMTPGAIDARELQPPGTRFPEDPRLIFFAFAAQAEQCAF